MIVSTKEARKMKERKHHMAQEMVSILREHLLDGVPLSQVREKHRLAPTVFYPRSCGGVFGLWTMTSFLDHTEV